MTFQALPLPGISQFSQHSFKHDPQFTTVQSIHDHVTVLPTKTRPKKLNFQGSDGRQYYFLLKGGEDLVSPF
jgi:PI-3-kinase-related kinase SMG-1